jgi:hypothetical protein
VKRKPDTKQTLIDRTTRVGASTRKAEEQTGTTCNPPQAGLETTPAHKPRHPAVLPVPRPLPEAVKKGNFCTSLQTGKPIRPGRAEVRAITEHHAERMIEILERMRQIVRTPLGFRERDLLDGEYRSKLAMYTEDFGEDQAARLDSYCRHQQGRSR